MYSVYKDKLQNCSCNQFQQIPRLYMYEADVRNSVQSLYINHP
jgi:hypothetical protein